MSEIELLSIEEIIEKLSPPSGGNKNRETTSGLIRTLLAKANLGVDKVAEIAECDQETVRRWLRGEFAPRREAINKLRHYFIGGSADKLKNRAIPPTHLEALLMAASNGLKPTLNHLDFLHETEARLQITLSAATGSALLIDKFQRPCLTSSASET